MTPAEQSYQLAAVQLRIARARLLHQIARPDVALGDLLRFARAIGDGDSTAVDSVSAFRSAQNEQLRLAQIELDRLSC